MSCKLIFSVVCVACMLICVIVIVRTFTLVPRQDVVIACKTTVKDYINMTDDILKRFQQSLQFKTVSTKPGEVNRDQLLGLDNYIQKKFPVIHSSPLVTVETIANYSLLYTVSGSNKSLTPYLLMAHLDVVPAMAEDWELPPFEAQIKDDFM